ncbi:MULTISPECIES: hypothetical protein [Rhizobium]|uniref:hypothetical protein n=1 Tax=Rhizobium TaxID=379 RepID=UPI0010320678|nr:MULTISPECIES: hypothetical protein [Rhizobium]TAX51901.1 hypothetical protein ELH99_17840 [Rhizobium leguminosarum]TBB50241.1 hypothetical protein ELH46_16370 [Rhizobium ruizarguesonis]TCB17912.1 hypothetical protein E0J18_12630 [Rhizobium leguminosarum bv. viciae]
MRTAVFMLIAVVSCIIFELAPAFAENPSRDKCTCDLEKGDPPENGAWIQNATSCWSTEIRQRQWCDITVQSLASGTGQTSVVLDLLAKGNDPTSVTAAMQDRFQQFAATASRSDTGLDIKRAIEVVPGILKANDDVIQRCVGAASEGKRGVRIEGRDTLMCEVSEVSGWLRIDFRVGDALVAYMIGSP